MVALSASRLVCAAIEWISLTTSPIFSAPVESAPTVALVRSASPTALLAISLERATWREISATELESSSAADATVPTLSDERCDAAPTVAARALASLAVDVIDCAVVCMPAAAVETERTMPVTLRSKSLAIFSIAARRSAAARACASASFCSSPRIRTALSLKIWTVAAIAPISSPRPAPGISPSSLPSASVLHAGAELTERLGDAAADHPGDAAGNQRDAENGEPEQPGDRLHLGVEIVEIGAGAEIHVEAGDGDGVADLADRLFLAGLDSIRSTAGSSRWPSTPSINSRTACGHWSRRPCGWCRPAWDPAPASVMPS